ncbi:uncharacterized protein LOC113872028 [Abrus precatorius]|uniref:Uncharacterized protein LOC113872028 n=1 Tax=Abrus precatorius TaxID=3816 RepID=A0A8B8MAZ8_ABRPR|nr:uncharacterized protein LOC113872028 [Abrus precatorius]
MQYRRREEEHAALSPSSKLRAPHRGEAGSDPFRRNRRDVLDRSPVQQSPLKVDGVRRVGGGNKGGGSEGFEGRDYDWHLGGRRSGRARSRSPPAEQVRKRSHFDDGVDHRSCSPPPPMGLRARYELSKTMDYSVDNENLDAKRAYLNREKELIDSRLGGGKGVVDQKFVIRENETGGSYRYRSIPDMGVSVTTRYEEAGGHLPPMSRAVPMGRFEHERLQHRDTPPMDKIPITESHSGTEKTILHARDVSYAPVSPSYARDFAGTSHMRDYGSSSIEMRRSDFLCSHDDGMCLPTTSYDLSRSSRKLAEPLGFSGHGQRTHVDTARGPQIGHRNMMCHQRCEVSPPRSEHVDYLNSKLQVRAAQDERLYQYDDLRRRIAPHGRLDYEQAVMEYDTSESSRPYISNPDFDRTGNREESYGNQRRGNIHDHPALQKPKYFDYHDVRRTSIASMQGEAYLQSGYNHLEIGKRMPQDYEVYMGAPEADRLSILRTEYESRRDSDPGLQQERFQNSPLSKHNSETYRQAVRVQEMRQDIGIHDHSDRLMKRKCNANDEIDMHDLRTVKPSKWNATEEFQDVYETEEWVDVGDMDMLYSSGNVGFNHKIYRKYKKEYDELENEEDFPSDEWNLPQDSMGHVQRNSFRFQKYSNQNIKHHSKSSSSNWYKPQHFSKRNAIQKQHKVWKKYGYDEDNHTTNDESSEDLINAAESEPTEGSEEFNQMVHENFLMYSKKLNLNLFVQRRYQDQGKAGSLYCIVCGRSSSKEFMDTQRLVTHAYMSHKAGLRAKHLGLHKAICVLMGWDTVVPQDTVTWVPQVLPHAEALAQKEDLILWPPIVIIHNISMSDDNPQNWKVVSMETIEAFLRGKGFVRGRIKLCLGKPADQSIILVKFLGTFVGLGDAERLHKYLSDNNRGRAEYERLKSESIKSCNIRETDQGDKVENILCGYVGIAEDFDKLDFNSKKWSMVKSRKEIDDLDNAPVKTDERR